MAPGATIQTTDMSGSQIRLPQAGRLIVKVIGIGLILGDIRGSMTLPGVTHQSTMDVG